MLYRSRKQLPWEAFEDPVPVRRRAEVQAEAISYIHGDLQARIGQVIGDLSYMAGSGTRVPTGHGRNEDGRG
jgi:hypothetical protein